MKVDNSVHCTDTRIYMVNKLLEALDVVCRIDIF